MHIIFKKNNLEKTLDLEGTVLDVLRHLKINPETVIVSVNGTLVDENTSVKKDDVLEIFR